MVMNVRPDGWADTQRICPDGRARERAIWSNPKGGPKWGDRSAAKPGRYHSVSARLVVSRSSPLRPVAMTAICGTGHSVVKRFLKIDKLSTALGTTDKEPRHYRYGYGVLDENLNGQVDPGEKRIYFEVGEFNAYVFFENPH